jgi:RNA polymerase sigma-70 factor (ECF subfamily)
VDAGAEDAALVAAARASRQAFRPLYERHVQPIYRYCFVRLGSREAAEDATSEVFMKALAGLGGYRGGLFLAWLYRIAGNVVADARRREGRGQPNLPLDVVGQLAEPSSDPDTAIMLRAALDSLPDDLRTTMELQLAGWTSEQAGAALGKSASAVRMARARALDQLRDHLTGASTGTTSQRGGASC